MNNTLEINSLEKKYNSFVAVKGINLQVKKGEVFGFLGPNGAGKTTTIKSCAGLLRPSSGSIKICGYDIITHGSKAKKNLGFVPDNPYMYEKLSGREFCLLAARLYNTKEEGLKRKISEYFTLFEMEKEMNNLIGSYSRGMKQKTAIIAALLHRPPLLLVDEPTANLDPKSARIVKDIFQSWKQAGRSVFMSTHVMEIAESLCDRIGIIHKGELLAVDSIAKIKGHNSETLEQAFLKLTGSEDEKTQELLLELSKEDK